MSASFARLHVNRWAVVRILVIAATFLIGVSINRYTSSALTEGSIGNRFIGSLQFRHASEVIDAVISRSGKLIASCDEQGSYIWRVSDGLCLLSVRCDDRPTCIAISENEELFAIGTLGGKIVVSSVSSGEQRHGFDCNSSANERFGNVPGPQPLPHTPGRIAFGPNDEDVIVLVEEGVLSWSLEANSLTLGKRVFFLMDYCPAKHSVYSLTVDRDAVTCVDLGTPENTSRLVTPRVKHQLQKAHVSRDGRYAATAFVTGSAGNPRVNFNGQFTSPKKWTLHVYSTQRLEQLFSIDVVCDSIRQLRIIGNDFLFVWQDDELVIHKISGVPIRRTYPAFVQHRLVLVRFPDDDRLLLGGSGHCLNIIRLDSELRVPDAVWEPSRIFNGSSSNDFWISHRAYLVQYDPSGPAAVELIRQVPVHDVRSSLVICGQKVLEFNHQRARIKNAITGIDLELPARDSRIVCGAISTDGNVVAVGGSRTIAAISANDGTLFQEWDFSQKHGEREALRHLVISGYGGWIAAFITGRFSSSICLWQRGLTSSIQGPRLKNGDECEFLSFMDKDRLLFLVISSIDDAGRKHRKCITWDLYSHETVSQFSLPLAGRGSYIRIGPIGGLDAPLSMVVGERDDAQFYHVRVLYERATPLPRSISSREPLYNAVLTSTHCVSMTADGRIRLELMSADSFDSSKTVPANVTKDLVRRFAESKTMSFSDLRDILSVKDCALLQVLSAFERVDIAPVDIPQDVLIRLGADDQRTRELAFKELLSVGMRGIENVTAVLAKGGLDVEVRARLERYLLEMGILPLQNNQDREFVRLVRILDLLNLPEAESILKRIASAPNCSSWYRELARRSCDPTF